MDVDVPLESVRHLRALMRRGSVTPTELVAMSLDAIRVRDPEIKAFVEVLDDQSRREASRIRPDDQRPLAGIPVAVKENRGVAGALLEYGSRALAGHRARADSPAVALLRAAGAIIVGTTAMSEFGLLPGCETAAHGPTRNPLDTELSTGGSSGGSAAAVAAGMVPLALGNDAGGIVADPGCVVRPDHSGHRGRRASARFRGVAPGDGLLARSLEDVLIGQRALDNALPLRTGNVGPELATVRVFLLTTPPDAADAGHFDVGIVREVADRLARVGIAVSECSSIWSDPAATRFFPAVGPRARDQILSAFDDAGVTSHDVVEEYTRSFLGHAARVSRPSRLRAEGELARWSMELTRWLGANAVLLCPTTLARPPRLGLLTGDRSIEDAAPRPRRPDLVHVACKRPRLVVGGRARPEWETDTRFGAGRRTAG